MKVYNELFSDIESLDLLCTRCSDKCLHHFHGSVDEMCTDEIEPGQFLESILVTYRLMQCSSCNQIGLWVMGDKHVPGREPEWAHCVYRSVSHPKPDFSSINIDPSMIKILNETWYEIHRSMEKNNSLASVILMGSLMEGILSSILEKNRSNLQNSKTATAPNSKKGELANRDMNDWTLDEMITVAQELNWISPQTEAFSKELKNFRNLVHPDRQKRENIVPDAALSNVCWGALKNLLDGLAKTKGKHSP